MIEEIGGSAQAAEWFEKEQHVLLAAIAEAAEGGYAPYAWELPWVAGWYFQDKACWRRLAAAQEAALAVATRLGDVAGRAMALQHLGWLRFLLGDTVSADRHLDEASRLAGQLGDQRFCALVGLHRAYVWQAQGRVQGAMTEARRALRIYHALADPRGEARALYAIGWCLIQLGDHQHAIHFSSRALVVGRESLAAAGC
jgi:tetratricopeptide (TPR) repeat protein